MDNKEPQDLRVKEMQKGDAKNPQQSQKCPRCDSLNTKFCYYNNYSLSQPRYFCKSCRKYWTQAGTIRIRRNAAEGSRDAGYDSAEARGKGGEMSKRAKITVSEGIDMAKEQAQEVKESTKEYEQDAEDREGKSSECEREG